MSFNFTYSWGNNAKRASLKGRACRILAQGQMRSCLVEFKDGQREIVSRRALRKKSRSEDRLFAP